MDRGYLRGAEEGVTISLRVSPGALGVSASEVEVIRGGSGREKTVPARAASEERASRALDGLLGG